MEHSGFVDLQVNGYGGVNFSSDSLEVEDVFTVTGQLARLGTLAFCPTVITSSMQTYRHALPVLVEAMQAPAYRGRLLGIHLEGPFLSPIDGARGVHPLAHVQMPDLAVFEELFDLASGMVSLLTIAPELPGAPEMMKYAAARGVVVSIGHTLADAAQIRTAVDAGARLSTHLGNGLPNTIHRHHNPLWPQLAEKELSAMLITDGHHLPAETIAAFVSAKGPGRILVTSDIAPAAGLPAGEYSFFGSRVLLEPGGRLRNLEQDTLAGSASSMFECMNHLASLELLCEEDLWRAGRDLPLAVLGKTPADLPLPGNVNWNGHQFILEELVEK